MVLAGNDLHPEHSALAEYIIVKKYCYWIPPNISFEEAATFGCVLATIALGMYRHLELPPLPLLLDGKRLMGGLFWFMGQVQRQECLPHSLRNCK